MLAQYGGRYLVRGGALEMAEGAMSIDRLVILEFPSIEAARTWHASPEYAPLLALRASAAISNLASVDGYAPA